MSLPQPKLEPADNGLTCVPVMFTSTSMQALEDLQRRFPDESADNLINHALQVFWARTMPFEVPI